jgi:hypothetical protein
MQRAGYSKRGDQRQISQRRVAERICPLKQSTAEINLDLPANLSATIDAKTFNGAIN